MRRTLSRGFLAIAVMTFAAVRSPVIAAPDSASSTAVERRIPDTMMFSIDELNEIQSHAVKAQNDGTRNNADAIENAHLYVSTIVYSNPKEWTAWINGVPVGPRQDFQDFKVVDIGPEYVELLIPLSALGMRPVRLAPNQTLIVKTGSVVEGSWR